MRRFIHNFAEIVKLITNMLKKDREVKWTATTQVYFDHINKAIGKARVLVSPNYDKDFQIFSFASEHTVVAILDLKNRGF